MPVEQTTRSESVLQGLNDDGGVWLSIDHPLVKQLHREVAAKQAARERLERKHYVDPRDIRFVMGGR